jgi:hypothetical protein
LVDNYAPGLKFDWQRIKFEDPNKKKKYKRRELDKVNSLGICQVGK